MVGFGAHFFKNVAKQDTTSFSFFDVHSWPLTGSCFQKCLRITTIVPKAFPILLLNTSLKKLITFDPQWSSLLRLLIVKTQILFAYYKALFQHNFRQLHKTSLLQVVILLYHTLNYSCLYYLVFISINHQQLANINIDMMGQEKIAKQRGMLEWG